MSQTSHIIPIVKQLVGENSLGEALELCQWTLECARSTVDFSRACLDSSLAELMRLRALILFWIGDYESASDALYELAMSEKDDPELEHQAPVDALNAVCARAAMLDPVKINEAADMLKQLLLLPAFASSCAMVSATWVMMSVLHCERSFLDRVQLDDDMTNAMVRLIQSLLST